MLENSGWLLRACAHHVTVLTRAVTGLKQDSAPCGNSVRRVVYKVAIPVRLATKQGLRWKLVQFERCCYVAYGFLDGGGST